MEAIMSTPITIIELLMGKLLPYFVLGMVAMSICVMITLTWFDIPFRGSFWLSGCNLLCLSFSGTYTGTAYLYRVQKPVCCCTGSTDHRFFAGASALGIYFPDQFYALVASVYYPYYPCTLLCVNPSDPFSYGRYLCSGHTQPDSYGHSGLRSSLLLFLRSPERG